VNGDPAAMFDGRTFHWIGNMNKEYDACVVQKQSPLRSTADLYKQELVVGASGAGAQSFSFPIVYREVLGLKFKVIAGYNTLPDRVIAMERGELPGNCGFNTGSIASTLSEPYRLGQFRILFQAALSKDKRFPDIPNVLEEAKTDADRRALEYMFATLELGRPFATAPETPSDRVDLLRTAFVRAMADPNLITEAGKMQLDIDWMTGVDTAASVGRLYQTPQSVIDRVQSILAVKP
jgi:tripartite-type tricarboxylate transporter receptor subunit TctC